MARGARVKKSLAAFNDNTQANPKADPPKRERQRQRPHPGRQALPAHLPREEIIHDLKPEEKACDKCGGFLSLIGCEEREQLETTFLKFVVKKHKRQK